MSILQRLYDSEINVWITSFWDDGFYVRLGDEMNGFRAEGRCDTWAAVELWLDQQARVHYPDSVKFMRTRARGVSIVATDLNQAMLDHASSRLSSAQVTWQQADAQSLPFPDGSFDVVVCQFGVMFFPDKPKAFREARRALKPDGRFLVSVWDRIETNEFADVVVQSVATLFPDGPPMFLARTPHGHHDTASLEAQLRAAGFVTVRTETIARESMSPSAQSVAIGYCQGTPMRSEIEARGPGRLAEATELAAAAIAARFGTGPITGRIQAHVITAIR